MEHGGGGQGGAGSDACSGVRASLKKVQFELAF